MELRNIPVQMLSVCGADGKMLPIRFRFEDEEHLMQTVSIDRVLSSNEVRYVGIEAVVFLCRAALGAKERLFELRYTLRTHRWVLLRVIY